MQNEGVDGPGIFLALARRWRWVAAGAIGGLLVAGVLVAVLPKRYVATGDLLVYDQPNEASDQTSRADTAAQLVHSIPVATGAMRELGGAGDPEDFLKSYRVSRLTNQLLRLEAWSTSPDLAAERASAIARAYLAYVAADQDETLATVTQAVDVKVADLSATIATLDDRISDLGAGAELTPEESVLLTSLVAQRETLAGELASNRARLEQAQTDRQRFLERNKLVAEPLVPSDPVSPRLRQFAVIGFLIGLVLSAGTVIVRDVLSGRLFRREELARAAGVSVIASPRLDVRAPITGRAQTTRIAKLVAEPSPDLSIACDALKSELRDVLARPHPTIAVVSMAAEAEALALTLRLAVDLLEESPSTTMRRVELADRRSPGASGRGVQFTRGDVVVIDVTSVDRLAVMPVLSELGVSDGAEGSSGVPNARAFRVRRTPESGVVWEPISGDSGGRDPLESWPVAPGTPIIAFAGEWRAASRARPMLGESGTSIIVTRPGRVTVSNVQECAAALRQASTPPHGVVVVNPDRFDTSTGQLAPPPPNEPRPNVGVEGADIERSAVRSL